MSVQALVLTDIMTDLRFSFLLFLLEIDVVLSCSFVKKGIMGIFDMFKSPRDAAKEEIIEVPWHVLATTDQLDEVVEESKNKPVAIFKHSTRCGISRGVLKSFEKDYNLNDEQLKLYFLDLLQNRDISNQIASRFNVRHESPQLIVIKGGAVIHHDSHNAIDASHLEQFV